MNSFEPAAAHPSDSDADALVRKALEADAQGDPDRAMALLQRSLAASSINPLAHYLIGAAHAEAGRHGDAVLHLSTAVEQAPLLAEARLQLGLLWLTLGNPSTGADVLRPLASLPSESALHHFGIALVAVAEERASDAAQSLRAGIATPCDNAALVGDMRRLLERVEAAATLPADLDAELQAAQHGLAISAYGAGESSGR